MNFRQQMAPGRLQEEEPPPMKIDRLQVLPNRASELVPI